MSNMEPVTENAIMENEAPPLWEVIVIIITLSIIIIFTVVGNVLVIFCVFTYKPLKKPQNFLIVLLATTDLIGAIIVMPISVAALVAGYWNFGPILCKIWLISNLIYCTSSIVTLCAIGLDRYWAITDPLNYAQRRTFKHVMYMILGVWIITAVISFAPLLGWNNWNSNVTGYVNCRPDWDLSFVVFSSLGSFYVPLFIMSVTYGEIYIVTKKSLAVRDRMLNSNSNTGNIERCRDHDSMELKSRGNRFPPVSRLQCDIPNTFKTNFFRSLFLKISRCTGSNTSYSDREQCSAELFDTQQVSRRRLNISKEWRVARTLGIIMGVFVVCWMPYFLMNVIVSSKNVTLSSRVVNFIIWLSYTSSALNPFIYTIFNIDFRRAFKKLLRIREKIIT